MIYVFIKPKLLQIKRSSMFQLLWVELSITWIKKLSAQKLKKLLIGFIAVFARKYPIYVWQIKIPKIIKKNWYIHFNYFFIFLIVIAHFGDNREGRHRKILVFFFLHTYLFKIYVVNKNETFFNFKYFKGVSVKDSKTSTPTCPIVTDFITVRTTDGGMIDFRS